MKANLVALEDIAMHLHEEGSIRSRDKVLVAVTELRAARAVVEAAKELGDNLGLKIDDEPDFYAALLAYDKVVGS